MDPHVPTSVISSVNIPVLCHPSLLLDYLQVNCSSCTEKREVAAGMWAMGPDTGCAVEWLGSWRQPALPLLLGPPVQTPPLGGCVGREGWCTSPGPPSRCAGPGPGMQVLTGPVILPQRMCVLTTAEEWGLLGEGAQVCPGGH